MNLCVILVREIHTTEKIEGNSLAFYGVVADALSQHEAQVQVLETVAHEIGVGKQENSLAQVMGEAHTSAVFVRRDVWPRAG